MGALSSEYFVIYQEHELGRSEAYQGMNAYHICDSLMQKERKSHSAARLYALPSWTATEGAMRLTLLSSAALISARFSDSRACMPL
jgi:hypothetical protein